MKISVITVCFNAAATLRATLESIAAQREADFEHIVVDGGSTDGTLDILRDWQGHPVRLLNGPDRGIYDAMNKGIAVAQGEVIGFLNADDRYAGERTLARIAAAFSDLAVDCCYGDLVHVDGPDRHVTRYWQSSDFRPVDFRFGWMPAHPTLYVRRRLVDAVGPFSLSYRIAADIEWMMRLLLRPGVRCVYIPHILAEQTAGGVSNAGSGAFLRANREVWQACRTLGVAPMPFVFGKTLRKISQWLRRPQAA